MRENSRLSNWFRITVVLTIILSLWDVIFTLLGEFSFQSAYPSLGVLISAGMYSLHDDGADTPSSEDGDESTQVTDTLAITPVSYFGWAIKTTILCFLFAVAVVWVDAMTFNILFQEPFTTVMAAIIVVIALAGGWFMERYRVYADVEEGSE